MVEVARKAGTGQEEHLVERRDKVTDLGNRLVVDLGIPWEELQGEPLVEHLEVLLGSHLAARDILREDILVMGNRLEVGNLVELILVGKREGSGLDNLEEPNLVDRQEEPSNILVVLTLDTHYHDA